MANPLQQLILFGQSFWLDNLSRTIISSGELQALIRDDGLRGITSNPTIFEKALSSTDEYDTETEQLVLQGKNAADIFEELTIHDIRRAADLLRPVYKATNGDDGYVSLELPPYLATDTERSISEAKRLFESIGRQNVMIKVPGTDEGIPAFQELIASGVNINVTLLFSLQAYEQVAEAYIAGLEERVKRGQPVDRIASVASFFVSRVDTEVDARLDKLIEQTSDEQQRARLAALKGKVGIANAKIAYERFTRIFLKSDRFQALQREHGARLQRPLWASTSTKNPEYSDVLYIEALIGPHTVETMAPASIDAFRDHGEVRRTVDEGIDEAHRILAELAEVGISYDDVTAVLQEQGVDAFAKSFDSVIAGIEKKRAVIASRTGERMDWLGDAEPPVRAMVERLSRDKVAERLWQRDTSLWSDNADVQRSISDRLGWLDSPETMMAELPRLEALAEDIREAGFQYAVLLGMGGSSLAPEVYQRTLGNQTSFPELIVLDSTNPDTISRVERSLDLSKTLFIVSSKSGTTVETSSLMEYFYRRLSNVRGNDAGQHFVAITDPDTKLNRIARERGFRDLFINPPDIGGRYSALTFFGLVPAAIIGIDVRVLLERAQAMAEQLRTPGENNPGLWLGGVLGTLALIGRDKLTFILDPALESLADWLEQLIAESTGKEGTGIIPIANEPYGAPNVYGADRAFVSFDLVPQPHSLTDAFRKGIEAAGHPVIRIPLRDEWDIAAEFLRWEVATAIAGVVLKINPFDEPNVQESKDITNHLLDEFQRNRKLPQPGPSAETEGISATGIDAASLQEATALFLSKIGFGDYLAITAFADNTPEIQIRLQEIRRLLRDRIEIATTLGTGPRYLHSIGQLYKGGPASGAFLQIVINPGQDIPIPDAPYSFGTLFQAQGLGDFEALSQRERPLLRFEINEDPILGLNRILQLVAVSALR